MNQEEFMAYIKSGVVVSNTELSDGGMLIPERMPFYKQGIGYRLLRWCGWKNAGYLGELPLYETLLKLRDGVKID